MSETAFIVFVGPSFPPARVPELVANADVRPPVRRGDLDAIAGPAVVALIDGVFDAELSVSPREIRNALARGVRVLGASSMGALRAAEVHEMIGVGRIYEMYRDETLQRDDEVAILLDTETHRALTEPLANVRFAAARLVSEGSLDEAHGAAIVEAAARLHFHDRVYRNILREAGLATLPDADALIAALKGIDLKREDAHTLLERLPELARSAHWDRVPLREVRANDYVDHFDRVRAKRTVPADAPLFIWEMGGSIEIGTLITFLALTGKLDAYARRAVGRYVLADGTIDDPAEEPRTRAIPVQDMFETATIEWGWRSKEEIHVTLTDLGIGQDELESHLGDERAARRKLAAVLEQRPDPLLHALRVELFTNDLGLKREAMRLGALRSLAASADDPSAPTEAERLEAKRALLCERAELSWAGLLAEGAIDEPEAEPLVALVARARRRGIEIVDRLDRAPADPGREARGLDFLPAAPRASEGATRSIDDVEAARLARALGRTIGVTRIAQLGELDRFGLHVTAAYRPSAWSSTMGSGKSESKDGAVAGAIMEEVEKYCQERFEVDAIERASFDDLQSRSGGAQAVDPLDLALPYDSPYRASEPIAWSWASDLVSGDRVLVPQSHLSFRREARDVLFSARRGTKIFSSNGLASGFTITEAILHAVCERIERHTLKLAEQEIGNPGRLAETAWPAFRFVDLSTCPASTRRIVQRIAACGFETRVLDVTGEVTVPTFTVRLVRPDPVHGITDKFCVGSCTHPSPELAINRALLEAIQSRLASISGAREDFGLKARSLGRHERPRPLARGDAYWIRPHVPKVRFDSIAGFTSGDAKDDLAFVLRRLTAASFDRVLYRDLTDPGVAPAHVVRVLVPGMEDTNPFFTGPRARVRLVRELMRRHAW